MPAERITATAVRQRQDGGAPDVVLSDLNHAVQRRQRPRGPGGDDVAADTVDAQFGAGTGDPHKLALGQSDGRNKRPRSHDPIAQSVVVSSESGAESGRVALERQSAADDLRTLRRVGGRGHLDPEAEAVEQLRP
jgi:hypothetical protein